MAANKEIPGFVSEVDDPYAIFGVQSSCDLKDLKKRYQELLLRFHPDKTCSRDSRGRTNSSLEDAPISDGEKFRRLETSWRLLRDPESRRVWDDSVRQRDRLQSHPVGDRVSLTEMNAEVEDDITTWSYGCRCGGEYVLNSLDELYRQSHERDEMLLCCSDCSLAIAVYIDFVPSYKE